MANIRITQLPTNPSAITGAELVPIVQNGETVQTTISQITQSPSQTQTFLTVGQQSTLPNSRYIGGGLGIGSSDGGAQGLYSLFLNGTSASLENASTGLIAKTAVNTVASRQVAAGTAGLSVANGNGVSGDPTVSLTGLALSAATLSGNGIVSTVNGTSFQNVTLTGTTSQISIANPNGGSNPTFSIANNPVLPGAAGAVVPSGTTGDRAAVPTNGTIRYNTTTSRFEFYQGGAWVNAGLGDGTVTYVYGTANQITVTNNTTTPVVSITDNPVIPGTSALTVPKGATAQRSPSPVNGMIRYNTDTALFEGYLNGAWSAFASGSGVTSVATGTGLTGGPITSTGTISIANTAVTAGSYTAATITVNAQGQITAASNTTYVSSFSAGTTGLTPATPTNSDIVLGGILIPANGGTGVGTLTGYVKGNGTLAMTASPTVPTTDLSGTVSNAQLANSSLTVGTTNIALGATSLTLGGLTSVAVTQDPTTAFQLATKQYVDGLVSSGISYHQPVQCATTQSLAAQTGGTVTYNNGASGVGATITLSVPLFVLDGYILLDTNRILVKNEINQAYNGVYTWATGGTVLTRSTDTNSYGPGPTQLSEGDYFFTQNGTVNAGNAYVVATVGVIIFGTTSIVFSQFSTSQVYTGTSPINVTGTVISLTTVPTNLGGTNITSYTAGDLLYATNSTTLTKLPIGTSGQVLKSTGTLPAWQLNPTYLPVVLHDGSSTNVSVASGYLPVLLHNGVTTVNVALF